MDAFFNKKSGSSSSSSSRRRSRSNDVVSSGDLSPHEDHKKSTAASKFKGIGRKMSLATTSMDKFARSTKDKWNRKLGKQENDGDSSRGRGDSTISNIPPGLEDDLNNSEQNETNNSPQNDKAESNPSTTESRRSFSADFINTEVDSPPPAPESSGTPKKGHSPLKIDKPFKAFGEKITHVAKKTGRRMSQFGNEIEQGVAKLGQQLQIKDSSEASEEDNSGENTAISDITTSSPDGRASHIPEGGDPTFPRMQRRVSDVLEIDKTNIEETGGTCIHDPAPEEYVSKISQMENLFDDSAAPESDLSKPSTPKTLGLICPFRSNYDVFTFFLSGSAIKKMKNKVLSHSDSNSNSYSIEFEDDEDITEIPSSLSGHQELDNWV